MTICRAHLVATIFAGTFAGCGGHYLYGPLGAVVAQPRSKGCDFTVVERVPERAYDALGVLALEDIAGKTPGDEAGFKKSVAAQVCSAGGDGVVAERDREGRYVRGTVVRFR